MDGSTVLPTLAPKVPPRSYLFTTQFFSSKTNPFESRGCKKNNTPQWNQNAKTTTEKNHVKINSCSAGIPKNTFVVFHEKISRFKSTPKFTLLKLPIRCYGCAREAILFSARGRSDGTIGPGAKRPRKFQRLRLRCR